MKRITALILFVLLVLINTLNARAATNLVFMGNYFFNPTNITINVGDYIRWTNNSLSVHDASRTNINQNPWFTGNVAANNGLSIAIRFTNAGFFPYFCNNHVYPTAGGTPRPQQTGTVSVVTANLPPSVSLTNPANNAKFSAPANLLLQASTTDDGTVTNVQFFSGATLLGNDPTAPFSFTLNNAAASNYTFTARAQDNGGLTATSAPITIFILTNALLTSPARLPDGQFRFTVQGIAGQTYAAESSTNLTLWSPFATNVAPANIFNITDSTSTNILQRYYRTRQDY